MSRGFNNDILTLGVLAIGGYLIYTKTDWFQQLFEAAKGIVADVKGSGGAGRRSSTGGDLPSTGGEGGDIGGGNLGAAKGSFMYPGTGKTWTAVDSGKKTRNYASGGSSGTTQWDIKNVGAVTNIETDLWVNVGGCGDEVSTKVFGPSHSGSNCCWLILNVDCASGTFQLGGEGPHPTTDKTNLGKGSSMGSIKNKEVGIKLVVSKSGGTFTAIGYGNTGSGWKEYIRKTFSQFGAKKKSSTPHGSATIQFRTDCSGVKYTVARAQEIRGGGAPASVGAGAGVGAAVEGQAEIPKKKKSNYTDMLFTINKPLPLGFYNSRMTTVLPINEPYCDQIPKGLGIPCYDRNDE